MVDLTETQARKWLDTYKKAWEKGDPDLAASLFHEDAVYRERRFTTPLNGREAIRKYWVNRVQDYQRDVMFDYQLWAVSGDTGYASWQAAFTWLPSNGRIELDGVFRLTFSSVKDHILVCQTFEEWFDLREL